MRNTHFVMLSQKDGVEVEFQDVDYTDYEGLIEGEDVSSKATIDCWCPTRAAVSSDENLDSYEHEVDENKEGSYEGSN